MTLQRLQGYHCPISLSGIRVLGRTALRFGRIRMLVLGYCSVFKTNIID